ncbi:MAG TPA: chromate efflux transporter [Armatimonadota bacterium]
MKYRVSALRLALTCLYIGVTGYGGPAIVGNMKQVFVDKKKWLTEEEFVTGLSLSQLLPSAIGVNTIEYIGYQLRGSLGAIIAPVCFIAPATILMAILSALYFAYGRLHAVQSLFIGLGAVVIALIINASFAVGKSAIKDVWGALLGLAGFVILQFLHGSVFVVAIFSAVAGFLIYRNKLESEPGEPRESGQTNTSGISWWTCSAIVLAVALVLTLTRHSEITKLILSVLRVGALTFGGGFMSIPWFHHEAVDVHHWLTDRQFLDGIALGQITPGPVLITANFIGYKVAGVFGALMGSIAIFTPGVAGMFVLAHQHEKVKHLVWLRAMIRGIIAGFMGVLLNVIIRLAEQSISGWKTAALAGISLVVLMIAKKDPLWVIIGGAAVSLLIFR